MGPRRKVPEDGATGDGLRGARGHPSQEGRHPAQGRCVNQHLGRQNVRNVGSEVDVWPRPSDVKTDVGRSGAERSPRERAVLLSTHRQPRESFHFFQQPQEKELTSGEMNSNVNFINPYNKYLNA